MSAVVYALFPSVEAAEAARIELQRTPERKTPPEIHLYERPPLEGNALPEGATEFGRNVLVAMAAGAVFMAALGGIAAALDLVLGLGVGMGIGLGFVTGLLMGLVGAMQAGTRMAKGPLRALEPRLAEGCVLLLTEVEGSEIDRCFELLTARQPLEVHVLGGW